MLSERTVKWLTRTGIMLPLVVTFYFVYKYGYTVPFWDEWEFVTFLEKFHNHTLTFTDFWAVHNEHRMLFPRILMLILANMSGWNILLEAYSSIIFAAFSLYCLFSMLDDIQDSQKYSILKIIISLLLFSMIQYENWLFSFSVQYYMAMTGVIASVWSINKWQGQMRGLVTAILAAIFSNYSLGAGLFIWPSVLLMLIFQKKWKLKHILIWIFAGFVTCASYFYKHPGSAFGLPMTLFLSQPLNFVKYIFSFLGAPLAQDISTAIWISLILFIIIILSMLDIRRLDKKRFDKMIPWLTLIIYVILNAVIIGMGRIHLGINQALSSRYTTISTLFVISAAVLLYNSIILNLEKNRKASLKDIVFILVVSLAFSVTYINSYKNGMSGMKKMSNRVNDSAICLKDPENASDEDLKNLYPIPELVRKRMKILSDMGIEFNLEK